MKTKGVLLVLIGAASFGLTPIFVKTGFEYGYSLGQLNISQMIIAFLLLWGMSLLKGLSVKSISNVDRMKVIATGTSVGLTSIFYYGAMQYLPASLAIILLFQFVWIGMIYEWMFSKSRPTAINIFSMFVTLTGVLFASNIIGGNVFEMSPMGLFLGLLSGFSYAGFIFFSGQVAINSHPILRSSLMISGSLILVLLVFFQDVSSLHLYDGRLWLIGAGIALVGAVIPPLFFAGGAPLISGRLANVLSSIELPVAIVAAMVVLSETVTLLQWVGIMLIIMAMIINELGAYLLNVLGKRRAK
ncbi:EamA family transporter [Pseudalkalibacillus hwajinpoensis]|uniref:DMT family transporter n=1 Tax=Guptibacillus hwajinpoensis TaxID=208199 RepID=A0A4U1MFG2_9BACL|nr:DMT family transporter [Pseudalkalibacillus hwajinpoensis]TKD69969.1 DMT family transporter [Pseudalkalibacillus hwajinpoensis]